ncbi:MAG: helix-hairpin-helix domain-containing protein [Candidatus Heimdallarchaeaceae archaeon]
MSTNEIENIKGIGPKAAKTLLDCGFNTVEKLAIATADELSQLPGIGKSTAENMILNAKEVLASVKKPVAKVPTKKAEVKPKVKKVDKETIPKPPTLKKKADEVSVHPSVKTPKSVAKPPAKKPAAKKPAVKPETKKLITKKPETKKLEAKPKATIAVKKGVSAATIKAIKRARAMPKIKSKTSKGKTKAKKKVTLSKTYGIVHSVLHDASGQSTNRSVILHLHDVELPISSYLGRKVNITYPRTNKQIIGTISRVHGKSKSRNKAVIVRFQRSVSPYIVTARATLK